MGNVLLASHTLGLLLSIYGAIKAKGVIWKLAAPLGIPTFYTYT